MTTHDKFGNSNSERERRGHRHHHHRPRILEKAKRVLEGSLNTIESSSSSLASSLKISEAPDVSEDAQWDLESCLAVLEAMNVRGLSDKERSAIRNLRAASGRVKAQPERRRDAVLFGFNLKMSSKTQPPINKELMQCFREVEENKEDTDQQNNVSDVLATFGGQIFHDASDVPPWMKRGNRAQGRVSGRLVRETTKQTFPNRGSLTVQGLPPRRSSSRRYGISSKDPLLRGSDSLLDFCHEYDDDPGIGVYCPPEWNALTIKARTELTDLLSWENLSLWDFDVVAAAELSRETMHKAYNTDVQVEQFCPLLFVGWAILCAPRAQQAMAGSLGPEGEGRCKAASVNSWPYLFVEDLDIEPEAVCNFLRQIEKGYHFDNPYHNNIHAADVTQTLLCLLQYIDYAEQIYDPVDVFCVLLAATFHDIGHRGTNNLFEKNARTELAIQYNDASILENMHSAVGHSLLMGEKKKEEWDVFNQWDNGQIERARTVMMTSVLGTDMSYHFNCLGELTSLVEKTQKDYMEDDTTNGGDEPQPILSIMCQFLGTRDNTEGSPLAEKCRKLADFFLKFFLHCADISNPTKKRKLCVYWADRALAEFFAQGDREDKLGIPISPLCDRNTTKRADSQIGFGKFVIRPTYQLLGEILPKVKAEVLPLIDSNIKYWTKEKTRLSILSAQGGRAGAPYMRGTDFEKKDGIEDIGEEGEEEEEEGDSADGGSSNADE